MYRNIHYLIPAHPLRHPPRVVAPILIGGYLPGIAAIVLYDLRQVFVDSVEHNTMPGTPDDGLIQPFATAAGAQDDFIPCGLFCLEGVNHALDRVADGGPPILNQTPVEVDSDDFRQAQPNWSTHQKYDLRVPSFQIMRSRSNFSRRCGGHARSRASVVRSLPSAFNTERTVSVAMR